MSTTTVDPATGRVTSCVCARVGLLGNPSDGYNGKTISFSLANFYAEVVVDPADVVSFVPHPDHDRFQYASLQGLATQVEAQGYYGGVRLMMAACKKFYDHCRDNGVPLQGPERPFRMAYDTTVPRQAGLAGSSAIVCAAINCLMAFFGVGPQHIPLEQRPALVLSAESELGITAGLQDRVIQVYGGCVYMDFDQALMAAQGHGRYERLDPALLPDGGRLYLMYCDNPSDSGRVHSTVRQRWLAGDVAVKEGMDAVAQCAVDGRAALERGDVHALAALMDRNFDLRRCMFGDTALGARNLRMVELARSHGAAAKFPGSGGAVLVLCPKGPVQAERLAFACHAEGFKLEPVTVGPANEA